MEYPPYNRRTSRKATARNTYQPRQQNNMAPDGYRKRSGARATRIKSGKNANMYCVFGWANPRNKPSFYAACFPATIPTQKQANPLDFKDRPVETIAKDRDGRPRLALGNDLHPVFERKARSGKMKQYCRWICEIKIDGVSQGLATGYSFPEDPMRVRLPKYNTTISPESNTTTITRDPRKMGRG